MKPKKKRTTKKPKRPLDIVYTMCVSDCGTTTFRPIRGRWETRRAPLPDFNRLSVNGPIACMSSMSITEQVFVMES